ncbi:MAG: asparaginase [Gaiellaceae bacterium]
MSQPLVEILRGGLVEAIHRGDVALVSASGELLASAGDPLGKITYWRSAAKPFQAMPVVSSGAAEQFAFSPEDVALTAASHNGEPVHVERAETLLARTGHSLDDLACGAHPPLDPASAEALARSGTPPTALHNNCSGKHIGMLAVAGRLGAEIDGYSEPDHPVQREILATIGRFTGLDVAEIAIGVDGCGVPCYGTSIYHLALAFARLMDEQADDSAALAVREAMTAHPYLVAGKERLDTDLMNIGAGALLSKGGAAGVQCVGLRGGRGLAVKIEDGAGAAPPVRPAGLVAVEVLRQLGVLDESSVTTLATYARPAIETIAGDRVGEARPVFDLGRPAAAA